MKLKSLFSVLAFVLTISITNKAFAATTANADTYWRYAGYIYDMSKVIVDVPGLKVINNPVGDPLPINDYKEYVHMVWPESFGTLTHEINFSYIYNPYTGYIKSIKIYSQKHTQNKNLLDVDIENIGWILDGTSFHFVTRAIVKDDNGKIEHIFGHSKEFSVLYDTDAEDYLK